jgi:probable blue pigment (indigoidine) exporter
METQMPSRRDLGLTALAPIIWGSTYIVTTEFLPQGIPLTVAMLRALPAGLLLLLLVRQLPSREWIGRILILGALNFAVFWALLFVSAYRLPGGVAATVGSVQALLVVFLSRVALGTPVRIMAVIAAGLGMSGVAFLLLTPKAALDPIGIAAGLGAAASMAGGTVFSRRWRPPVSLLAFTAWQLTAGGILLVPFVVLLEPTLPSLSNRNLLGLFYLSIIGAAITYFIWFRGIDRIAPSAISTIGFLSPVSAVILGWCFLDQTLSVGQILGAAIVLTSVWLGQKAVAAGNAAPKAADAKMSVEQAWKLKAGR